MPDEWQDRSELRSWIKAYIASNSICPNPIPWQAFYERLSSVGRDCSRPLILSGWSFSSNTDKRERLLLQLRWAEANRQIESALRFLDQLLPDDWHHGDPQSNVTGWEWLAELSEYGPCKCLLIDGAHCRFSTESWRRFTENYRSDLWNIDPHLAHQVSTACDDGLFDWAAAIDNIARTAYFVDEKGVVWRPRANDDFPSSIYAVHARVFDQTLTADSEIISASTEIGLPQYFGEAE